MTASNLLQLKNTFYPLVYLDGWPPRQAKTHSLGKKLVYSLKRCKCVIAYKHKCGTSLHPRLRCGISATAIDAVAVDCSHIDRRRAESSAQFIGRFLPVERLHLRS